MVLTVEQVEQQVLEQTKLFYASLPSLMTTHAGRWVVFRDGSVQSDHTTEAEAYLAAVERFGVNGGFVVACVQAAEAPTPITAGVMFGLA